MQISIAFLINRRYILFRYWSLSWLMNSIGNRIITFDDFDELICGSIIICIFAYLHIYARITWIFELFAWIICIDKWYLSFSLDILRDNKSLNVIRPNFIHSSKISPRVSCKSPQEKSISLHCLIERSLTLKMNLVNDIILSNIFIKS